MTRDRDTSKAEHSKTFRYIRSLYGNGAQDKRIVRPSTGRHRNGVTSFRRHILPNLHNVLNVIVTLPHTLRTSGSRFITTLVAISHIGAGNPTRRGHIITNTHIRRIVTNTASRNRITFITTRRIITNVTRRPIAILHHHRHVTMDITVR